MKINFQTACGIIAKEQGYNTWEELLADNAAHTHYYQLAADRYAMILDDQMNSIEELTDLQLELGYKRGELSTVAMLGLVGEAGEVLDELTISNSHFYALLPRALKDSKTAAKSIELYKKTIRKEEPVNIPLFEIKDKREDKFDAELADNFYYLNILAFNRNLTLCDLAQMAYDKIKRKQSEGGSSEDPKK